MCIKPYLLWMEIAFPYFDLRARHRSGFANVPCSRGCGELWVMLSPASCGNTLQGELSLRCHGCRHFTVVVDIEYHTV